MCLLAPRQCCYLQAFQKRCLAALACMEIAQSLCKAEDDRLFATICMNKIVAVLDKQLVSQQCSRIRLRLSSSNVFPGIATHAFVRYLTLLAAQVKKHDIEQRPEKVQPPVTVLELLKQARLHTFHMTSSYLLLINVSVHNCVGLKLWLMNIPVLQAAVQMQRHKLGLPLEATRGEQISVGIPKLAYTQVMAETELRSAQVSPLAYHAPTKPATQLAL